MIRAGAHGGLEAAGAKDMERGERGVLRIQPLHPVVHPTWCAPRHYSLGTRGQQVTLLISQIATSLTSVWVMAATFTV